MPFKQFTERNVVAGRALAGRKSIPPLTIQVTLLVFFAGLAARAQSLPAGVLDQLDTAIGQRVEATAVFGTQSIASRAGLGWTLDDATGRIYKIPWKTELRDPQPTGYHRLLWAPVFDGGVGYGGFVNHFDDNVLTGNESDYDTVALSLGGGPRIYFGDSGFSVLPAFDLLYAYTDNDFDANTPAGELVAANGQYVNWKVHTISFVPSFELQFKKAYGRWLPKFTSDFAYYNTRPIYRSTDALSFKSSSMLWANKFDLDYVTPWKVLECPVHFGGDISRTDLYAGLQAALDTDHYYQTDARATLDISGRIWKVDSVGLTGGYFWCSAFSGYSIGIECSLKF
ncbi:MAG TPA: Solitary outer membrane autotransporter beta-barrel domain [Candidatus Acidoferrales bacterium]|nr:Solitary outer membrane autotransporter beta-barrel domain [Candidatus Acidoferrales bacterium]